MGTNEIIRNSLIAALGIAGLTLSACASSGSTSDRYGSGSVYDYESGGDCDSGDRYGNNGCQAMVTPPAPTMAPPMTGPVTGVVYTDCTQMGAMGCDYMAPAPAPAPTYTPPTYTTGPIECPAGTTDNGDGTCMETSSSYSTESYSTMTSTYSTGETADCPPGTSRQGDGTCLQSSSSYSYTTTSSGPSTSMPIVCPAGTIMQPDGSCMESGYSSTGTYTNSDYLPIRK